MARPKEKATTAFEQKSEAAEEKLRGLEAERLAADMKKLFSEGLFADITVDGTGTVPLEVHACVIRARSRELLPKLTAQGTGQPGTKPLHVRLNQSGQLSEVFESLYTEDNITPALTQLAEILDQDSTTKIPTNDAMVKSPSVNINDCTLQNGLTPVSVNGETSCSAGHCDQNNSEGSNSEFSHLDKKPVTTSPNSDNTDGVRNGNCEAKQGADNDSQPSQAEDVPDCLKVSENGTTESGGKTSERKDKRSKLIRIHSSREMRKKSLQTLLKQKYGLENNVEACSELGEDLLCALLDEEDCDCVLQVQDFHLPAHRCILAARSSYFSAMLGGGWLESDQQLIPLEGVEASSLRHLLLYLYGGVTQLVPSYSLGALVMMADMYDMQGLKDVLIFHLHKDYCHFFHKACPGCISGVPDTLTLAMMYNMSTLKDQCLKWIGKHFVKVWPTKTFVSLPQEVLESCVTSTINDLAVNNVISTMVEFQRLNEKTPHLKWTEQLFDMITRLMDAAIEYASQHFLQVITSSTFRKIDQGGLPFDQTTLEAIFGMIIEALSPGLSCDAYIALEQWRAKFRACDGDEDKFAIYSQEFQSFVEFLFERTKSHLCRYIQQAANTVEWSRLPKHDQSQLITDANYVFIDEPAKSKMAPPKLTSMQKKISSFSHLSMKEYFDKHFPQKSNVTSQPKITILKNDRLKSSAASTSSSKPAATSRIAKSSTSTTTTKSSASATSVNSSANSTFAKSSANSTFAKSSANTISAKAAANTRPTRSSTSMGAARSSVSTNPGKSSGQPKSPRSADKKSNLKVTGTGKERRDTVACQSLGDNKKATVGSEVLEAGSASVSNKTLTKKSDFLKKGDEKNKRASSGAVAPGSAEVKKQKSKEPLDVYARAYKKNGNKSSLSKQGSQSASTEYLRQLSDLSQGNSDVCEKSSGSEDLAAAMATPFISRFGMAYEETERDACVAEVIPGKVFTAELVTFLEFSFYIPQ